MAPSAQYDLTTPPTDAISALAFAPNDPTRMLASSWDRNVYVYDIHGENEAGQKCGTLLRKFEHRAPVLWVCFGKDDNEAFSAGLDWRVLRLDLATGEQSVVSTHSAPVRSVAYSHEFSILVSASWDQTLHFHDVKSSSSNPISVSLPGKPHALSVSPTKVVVAMTSRLVSIYDLSTVAETFSADDSSPITIVPWQQRESSLKFLTRAVACMPNDAGYATSSIEGRVSVEWFDDSAESQARKYAFKCHRQSAPDSEGGGDIVYPVNALAFHPVYGTFASAGGDGNVALWDAEAKRRMRQYPKFSNNVAAVAFSNDGKHMAVGVCPGFQDGQEDYVAAGQVSIVIKELGETEAKGKGAK
ncbi:Mitotic checkpoint protein BUB3.2 [Ceratocystis fimbriata CBS 114723]|uniref:Mitotic checkpoint protein BUB3.2 n=1 Tax=Ceratocystis fimbriata CBS 114723 TaxID=1035309 RepID=A0A2C5WW07_9PEZI|nr:Mitotic checkpoint protein BUB3.2 [Ceratocystis fimbriata CBS 114723]